MWIFTKARSEEDDRHLMNIDAGSRISLTRLGGKWFVEVIIESEAHPLAVAESNEQATEILQRVFDALKAGESALDLESEPGSGSEPESKN